MDKLLKNKTAIVIFVAPALILFTVVLFIPIATSFYYALCEFDKATRTYNFIGFKNFSDAVKLPAFKTVMLNTFWCVISVVGLSTLLGL